jgi:hypothetical protein
MQCPDRLLGQDYSIDGVPVRSVNGSRHHNSLKIRKGQSATQPDGERGSPPTPESYALHPNSVPSRSRDSVVRNRTRRLSTGPTLAAPTVADGDRSRMPAGSGKGRVRAVSRRRQPHSLASPSATADVLVSPCAGVSRLPHHPFALGRKSPVDSGIAGTAEEWTEQSTSTAASIGGSHRATLPARGTRAAMEKGAGS